MNNIPLARLIEGIITTLRNDVIPHVGDAYARGQAVGVIDLLNNLAPRVDWASERLEASAAAKRALLEALARLAPEAVAPLQSGESVGANRLLADIGKLDAAICDAAAHLWQRRGEPAAAEALAMIRAHLHDEAAREMKTTRKPLFAEIASGKSG
ncbi:hypothetical protein [Arvimicrobium flavum]|uniref:hypothetical protein n=1 Tax=Arvimicrobium flavum TaxID=3393320 RepID=UPI00237A982F|nr:hypothetical protein [Mesorhizobium shangrilense]